MTGPTSSLFMTLVVGAIAGWLAGMVARGSGYGIIGDIVVGLLGALIGGYVFTFFHLPLNLGNMWIEKGVIAFIGAVVLLLLIGILRPRSVSERVGDWWRRR